MENKPTPTPTIEIGSINPDPVLYAMLDAISSWYNIPKKGFVPCKSIPETFLGKWESSETGNMWQIEEYAASFLHKGKAGLHMTPRSASQWLKVPDRDDLIINITPVGKDLILAEMRRLVGNKMSLKVISYKGTLSREIFQKTQKY